MSEGSFADFLRKGGSRLPCNLLGLAQATLNGLMPQKDVLRLVVDRLTWRGIAAGGNRGT